MKFFDILVVLTTMFSLITSSPIGTKSVRRFQKDFAQKTNGTNTRIVGGYEAVDGQFPYQVRIIAYQGIPGVDDERLFQCGGSIVALTWVLTAGHCYEENTDPLDPITYVVEAGSIIAGEPRQSDRVYFFDAYVHPKFSFDTLECDVGLLNTKPFKIDNYVQVVPMSFVLPSRALIGELLTVSGFGYISGTGPVSPVLKYTELTMITKEECDPYYILELPETCFCAVDRSTPLSGTCGGDSGGPIVHYVNDNPIQVGLVSFGSTKCESNTPQGYTDLSNLEVSTWVITTMLTN